LCSAISGPISRDAADIILKRHELNRRRRADFERSLQNPNPESIAIAELGFSGCARRQPEEDAGALVDLNAGTPVRWVPGEGWIEGE